MSVEFYRESPRKFDSRTLNWTIIDRWTGRMTTFESWPHRGTISEVFPRPRDQPQNKARKGTQRELGARTRPGKGPAARTRLGKGPFTITITKLLLLLSLSGPLNHRRRSRGLAQKGSLTVPDKARKGNPFWARPRDRRRWFKGPDNDNNSSNSNSNSNSSNNNNNNNNNSNSNSNSTDCNHCDCNHWVTTFCINMRNLLGWLETRLAQVTSTYLKLT